MTGGGRFALRRGRRVLDSRLMAIRLAAACLMGWAATTNYTVGDTASAFVNVVEPDTTGSGAGQALKSGLFAICLEAAADGMRLARAHRLTWIASLARRGIPSVEIRRHPLHRLFRPTFPLATSNLQRIMF